MTFSKKCKNMSTKQERASDAAFKARPFSSNFNFVFKDGQVAATTCKCYCPLVVSPTITNWCKELHLKCGRVPRSISENFAMHGTKSGFVWKPVFFLIISKCCPFYWKSLCFSLLLFTVWWSIFGQPFRRFLPLVSYF